MNYSNPFDNQEVTDYTIKTFGESLRQRREQLGISLRQMAKRVGMSAVYLSDIERGIRSAPSGINSKIDYMSALSRELKLNESQKKVFETMARLSYMRNLKLSDNYFNDNPSALKFFIIAVVENWDNEKWEELYNLVVDREK